MLLDVAYCIVSWYQVSNCMMSIGFTDVCTASHVWDAMIMQDYMYQLVFELMGRPLYTLVFHQTITELNGKCLIPSFEHEPYKKNVFFSFFFCEEIFIGHTCVNNYEI